MSPSTSHSHTHPSIQSFFAPVTSISHPRTCPTDSTAPTVGDGFTSSELAPMSPSTTVATSTFPTPNLHRFQPRVKYTELAIADLIPGPGRVKITGRVVNFYKIIGKGGRDGSSVSGSSSMHRAKGSWWCKIGDGTGVVTVRMHASPPFPSPSSYPPACIALQQCASCAFQSMSRHSFCLLERRGQG